MLLACMYHYTYTTTLNTGPLHPHHHAQLLTHRTHSPLRDLIRPTNVHAYSLTNTLYTSFLPFQGAVPSP